MQASLQKKPDNQIKMDLSRLPAMAINPLLLSVLLLVATPALLAHGKKGPEAMPFEDAKAARLMWLQKTTACVEEADDFEAMRACWPKRRRMAGKPDA